MPETIQAERRRYTRVNFNARAQLNQRGYTFSSNLVDISLNGVLLGTPTNYEIRADLPAEVKINLGDDTEICMSVHLVHSSSAFLGFECESIDLDSVAHLRRLVELNIGDPEAADRVLNELVRPESTA